MQVQTNLFQQSPSIKLKTCKAIIFKFKYKLLIKGKTNNLS